MKELDTKLLQIIGHFGVINQQSQLTQEVNEFQEAIHDLENARLDDYEKCLDHVIEELADVEVMIRQFQLIYGISNEDKILTMQYKVDRTIKRIKEGYYK